jgi:NaMN:DMB phosphoribosyltransferase
MSFKDSKLDILKLYDKGEAKEGVGAGAAIVYGYLRGLKQEDILQGVQRLLGV